MENTDQLAWMLGSFIVLWLSAGLVGCFVRNYRQDKTDAARWRRLMLVRKEFDAERLGNAIMRARFDEESA